MKKLGLFLATSICMFLVSATAFGATRTSVQSGPWSDAATWDTGVPATGDTADIVGPHTVTLTANTSVGTASGMVIVRIGAVLDLVGFTLTANTLTIETGGEVRQAGSSGAPAGTVTNRIYSTGSTYTFNGTQAGLTGTHPTYGNLNFAPTPAGGGTFGLNLSILGSLTINLGAAQEIRFATGATARTHSIGGNLNIQAGIVVGNNGTSSASVTVGGSLNITGGTFRGTNDTGGATFNIAGNIVNGGTWQLDDGSSTGVFTTNLNGGSGAQDISGANAISFEVLTINNSLGITLSRSIDVTSTLGFTLGVITTGANVLTIGSAGSVSGASPTTYVNGGLKKVYAATGVKGFEVGTANGYSPVSVNITAGTFPTDFTVRAVQGPQPNIVTPAAALQRYWKLAATGVTADFNFNYLDADVPPPPSTENSFVIFKWDGGFTMPGGSVNTATNEASISGVSDATLLSDWTLAQPNAPTASEGTVSGTIVDTAGNPIAGAVIHLSGTQNRKFITDANGYYQFDKVETTGFYTVTPLRANYGFSPGSRSFSQLANNTEAAFTAVASDQTRNPLDTPEYFVRQHYLDFLGREPDEAGFNFWSDQILECGNDAVCIERRTINVSAAYFLSIESQRTGGLVDRLYRASYGRNARYSEFVPDRAIIAKDVVVGKSGWERQLAANEETFVESFADRTAFHTAFDGLSNADYVDALISNTGVRFTETERDAMVGSINRGASRADVLQQIANNEGFAKARFNEAFVLMEYFGYLRRDPDDEGYRFWLNKLNQFDGNFERAEMVKAFINSGEYRARFIH